MLKPLDEALGVSQDLDALELASLLSGLHELSDALVSIHARDGIACHGADGPREQRFQGRSALTRKIRPARPTPAAVPLAHLSLKRKDKRGGKQDGKSGG